jgi:uncharacterized protein (TIGR02145 family)
MKPFFLFILLVVNVSFLNAQNSVGIGTNTPHPSAVLDLSSTSKGFLPPKMTTAQRNAIVSPAVGLTIYNITVNCLQWWNGTIWYDGCGNTQYATGSVFCFTGPTRVVDVINPSTGKIWMDRNLGATQVATSSTDAKSYGDLYQWGRRNDGHQCRASITTSTLSSTDHLDHSGFILATNAPWNWRSPQNTNLWQGVNGVNNPCPSGYRLPTDVEWEQERLSWTSNNAAGAFASPLKLPFGGIRTTHGELQMVDTDGQYWSSTVSGNNFRNINFEGSYAGMSALNGGAGASVRCIKN